MIFARSILNVLLRNTLLPPRRSLGQTPPQYQPAQSTGEQQILTLYRCSPPDRRADQRNGLWCVRRRATAMA